MRWIGPMLHMIFPPAFDPMTQQFAELLDERQVHIADLHASRATLERIAADRGTALDDLAGERG